MDLAAKLLAKARSTDSDAEAVALVEKSYGLLARVITAYDDEQPIGPGGTRRRERRYLRDRRVERRGATFAPTASRVDPVATYRQQAYGLRPPAKGNVDLSV
jgi:hypothetical protein